MKKIILIIYLIFSAMTFIAEIILDFREIKSSIYSLNYEKKFTSERLYLINTFPASMNGSSEGLIGIKGYLKKYPKIRSITLSVKNEVKIRKFENDQQYYDVWYSVDLDKLILKTTEKMIVYKNGFYLIILWCFLPLVIYKFKKSN